MDLSADTRREMFWKMLLARRLDERAWMLHRQGKIAFHISGIGHETAQVGAAYALRRGYDWIVPYYRDLALMLCLGYTPRDFILALMGKREDRTSGGRQMPSHWSLKEMNVLSHSSPVGTQATHAVGVGLGIKLSKEDRVVLTTIGEGATAQGDWYEAVNWAAIHKLPVVFNVQNNQYAISETVDKQMAVKSVAEKACGLGLNGVCVDGNDLFAVYAPIKRPSPTRAPGWAPPWSRRWSTASPRTPPTTTTAPTARGKRWRRTARTTVCCARATCSSAKACSPPTPWMKWKRASNPCWMRRSPTPRRPLSHPRKMNSARFMLRVRLPMPEITMIEAIRQAMDEEMARDERVFVVGEDVGRRGGVFRATQGLYEKYGAERVIDSPLAELSIAGVGIGAAAFGMRPICEIQFADYLHPAFNQIVNEAARMYYRSNGEWCVPMVIRAPYGGGIGGGLYHSQSVEAFYAHVPGLKVVIPSTPYDAKGLLKSAVRDPNPVLFFEPKNGYRLIRGEVPEGITACPSARRASAARAAI